MTTIYRLVAWNFWSDRFSRDIQRACQQSGVSVVAGVVGVDVKTVTNWAHANWSGDLPWPNMTNFIKVCNALDLDPRDYWIMGDTDA